MHRCGPHWVRRSDSSRTSGPSCCRRADPCQPCHSRRLDRTTRSARVVCRAGALHQSRARNRALCRSGWRVTGCSTDVRRVLDMALGPPGLLMATPLDRLLRRAWQARPRSRVRGDADGRHARACTGAWLLSAPLLRAIRARRPTSSTGTSRPSPRGRSTTSFCCRR